MPRAKVKAVYKPVDVVTLVLVDDRRGVLPSLQMQGLIAQRIGLDLVENKVLTRCVPLEELEALRAATPDFDKMAMDEVGRKLNAKQVLYVQVDGFDYTGNTQETFRPSASVRVKIVDVDTGRLFPAQREHLVTTTLFFKQNQFDSPTHADQALLGRKLADVLGRDIAAQFYDHEAREVGSGFED